MPSILGKEWLPSITISDVIAKIPEFVVIIARVYIPYRTNCMRTSRMQISSNLLVYFTWKRSTTLTGLILILPSTVREIPYRIEIFKCREESLADTGIEEGRIAVLTDSFLLLFEPEQKQTTAGDYARLTFSLNIANTVLIRRNLKLKDVIRIRWIQSGNDVILESVQYVDRLQN